MSLSHLVTSRKSKAPLGTTAVITIVIGLNFTGLNLRSATVGTANIEIRFVDVVELPRELPVADVVELSRELPAIDATTSATTDAHMTMTPNTTVAIAVTSTALVFNMTKQSRNAHSQSSVPRKVHANHSHAAISSALSHTKAETNKTLSQSYEKPECHVITSENADATVAPFLIFYHVYVPQDKGKEGVKNALRIVKEQLGLSPHAAL
jgi:hypothetical protein